MIHVNYGPLFERRVSATIANLSVDEINQVSGGDQGDATAGGAVT